MLSPYFLFNMETLYLNTFILPNLWTWSFITDCFGKIKYIKYAESYGNQTSMLKEILIQAFGGYVFQDYNSACNFLDISVGKVFSCYFCRIKGLHLKAAKIIEWLPKNIMDCDILQRVHRQNLGWFYKRRLAVEMSKEAKHMLNMLVCI